MNTVFRTYTCASEKIFENSVITIYRTRDFINAKVETIWTAVTGASHIVWCDYDLFAVVDYLKFNTAYITKMEYDMARSDIVNLLTI